MNKNILADDGTLVQSAGEKQIAEWLAAKNIVYRYDERIRIIEGYAVRPDFYLPEFDLYIEYWGMDTIDYKIGMLKKQKIYQMTGKKLVSLYPDDRPRLDVTMRNKLDKYILNEKRVKKSHITLYSMENEKLLNREELGEPHGNVSNIL